jgi:DNA polymerase/3'-5' exonuclease PolX
MPVHNSDIADLLELQGAHPFRIRAYRNAARMLNTRTLDELRPLLARTIGA